MAIEITAPRLGWTMEEGVFLGWLKQDGEAVREGEALYTLESDKSAQEVEATENGILRISPHAPVAGEKVRVGDLLGYIAEEGEDVAFIAAGSGIRGQKSVINDQPEQVPTDSCLPTPDSSSRSAPTISPRAARTAAALGVDWTKIRGTGRTGRIRERDVIAAAGRRTPDS